jgi:SAM-dependent methyltransferase
MMTLARSVMTCKVVLWRPRAHIIWQKLLSGRDTQSMKKEPLRLPSLILIRMARPVKLEDCKGPVIVNVGCGKRARANMINLDVVVTEGYTAPDYLIKDGSETGLPDACADEVMSIHNFEHYYRWQVDAVLVEWKRILKPGGQLTLELPDLIKACKNVLSGYSHSGKDPDQFSMWSLYGDPRGEDVYMAHHWSWSPATLRALLEKHGFVDIREAETLWHPGGRAHRDMRLESRKPAHA